MAANLVQQSPVADAQQLRRPLAIPSRVFEGAADGMDLRLITEAAERQFRKRRAIENPRTWSAPHVRSLILLDVSVAVGFCADFAHISPHPKSRATKVASRWAE